jgi:hypothetical protein
MGSLIQSMGSAIAGVGAVVIIILIGIFIYDLILKFKDYRYMKRIKHAQKSSMSNVTRLL